MIRVTIQEDDEIELNLSIPNPAYVRKIEDKAKFSDLYMKEMDQMREKVNQMTRIIKKLKKKKRSEKKKNKKQHQRKRLNSRKWYDIELTDFNFTASYMFSCYYIMHLHFNDFPSFYHK